MYRTLCAAIIALIAPAACADIVAAWEFNTDAFAEGWDGFWVNDLAVPFEVSDGILRTTVTGNDPYMTSPVVHMQASDIPRIRIRMRCDAGSALKAALYWITLDDSNWGEDKATSFEVLSDGAWHEYVVYLALHDRWTGTVRRIRFDPPAPQLPGDLEIDFIRLEHGPEAVTIDFRQTTGPVSSRAAGYLSDPPVGPSRPLIAALRPVLIRHQFNSGYMDPEHYGFVTGLGGRIQLIPGVSWWWMHPHPLQPPPGSFPGDNGDWAPWESFLDSLLTEAKLHGQSYDWDIWNEPDHTGSWNPVGLDPKARKARFFEAWRRAYSRIRALAPNDRIVGPSNSRFLGGLFSVTEFLEFARSTDTLPDVVSWHCSSADALVAQVEAVRSFMTARGITLRPISINEIVAEYEQTSPGELVRYYAAAERADVETAAHSCWTDPDAADPPFANCGNNSISGLLKEVGDERRPRSTYWVARAYAERTGTAVRVEPDDSIDGVAGYDEATDTATVILGRSDHGIGEVRLELLGLSAAGLPTDGLVHVKAAHMPHSGWDALEKPPFSFVSLSVPVKDALSVKLSDFGPDEAWVLKCSRPRFLGDLDRDLDVDQEDFGRLQACYSGPGVPGASPACDAADLDTDGDIDRSDFDCFRACMSGPTTLPETGCLD